MDTRDMAIELYEMAKDMDYEEQKEDAINDLDYALFYLKTAAENPYNHDGFRVLMEVLERITGTEV